MRVLNENTHNKAAVAAGIREKLEQMVKTGNISMSIHNQTDLDITFTCEKTSSGKYEFKLYTKEVIERDNIQPPEHTSFAKLRNFKWDISIKA